MHRNVIAEEISQCYLCQVSTPNTSRYQAFAEQELPEGLCIHIAFDICGSLPIEEEKGYRYLFLLIDQFTNYVIGAAARSQRADEMIDFFRLALLNYSIPSHLRVDGECGLLASREFDTFLGTYGIAKQLVSTGHPQSNGGIEKQMYSVVKELSE